MQKQALDFTPAELQVLKNYLMGGLAIGGGAGALMGVGNMAMDLRRQADDEVKEDDDTLFLTMPKKAEVGPLAIGAGAAGGVVSLLAANALIRKLFQAAKRRDVHSELDDAQRANLSSLDQLGKQAADGRSLGPSEVVGGGSVAAAILTALASGIVSYKALDKYFPAVKRPDNPLPKRVKILQQPEPGEPVIPGDEEADKMASADEFLIRQALTSAKAASTSLGDLVSAMAQGREEELTEILTKYGSDAMFAACAGACLIPVTKRAADLGITALTKSASLQPVGMLLAAGEVIEAFPALALTSRAMPEMDKLALYDYAAGLGAAFQATTLESVKEASSDEGKRNPEKMLRRAILAENNHAQPSELKQMKEHMAMAEVLGGVSGESANSEDARDSKDESPSEPKELQELVMGV